MHVCPVYEDALTFQGWGEPGLLDDELPEDGTPVWYNGLDPPPNSDGMSGGGTPVKANSLAGIAASS